jgi:hypothetical protein
MLERIQVYIKPGSQHAVDPSDLKMLIDYFHADLAKAIQPEAQIVTAPGPGVLRLRIGLTNLVPTNTMASLAGTAVPYVSSRRSVGRATGKAGGSTPYLGQRAWKSSFAMARRGRFVAECADTEIGPQVRGRHERGRRRRPPKLV